MDSKSAQIFSLAFNGIEVFSNFVIFHWKKLQNIFGTHILQPGANVIKHFTAAIYEFSY
jgi:hypothetical protein